MEQNEFKNQENVASNQKLQKIGKVVVVLLVVLYLVALGAMTYLNHQNISKNKHISDLFQKGMQIRTSYDTLKVTSIDKITYSQFPQRLLEIHADENILYSYRDDFYKDYSEPGTKIDRGKVVIYLTERQVFDNPVAVGEQPECEAMAKIESQKRPPEPYENEPTEITLKYLNGQMGEKIYIYTPKLGHCSKVFSDNQLLRVQRQANTIRYSF